jgi:hypothetical protein
LSINEKNHQKESLYQKRLERSFWLFTAFREEILPIGFYNQELEPNVLIAMHDICATKFIECKHIIKDFNEKQTEKLQALQEKIQTWTSINLMSLY